MLDKALLDSLEDKNCPGVIYYAPYPLPLLNCLCLNNILEKFMLRLKFYILFNEFNELIYYLNLKL